MINLFIRFYHTIFEIFNKLLLVTTIMRQGYRLIILRLIIILNFFFSILTLRLISDILFVNNCTGLYAHAIFIITKNNSLPFFLTVKLIFIRRNLFLLISRHDILILKTSKIIIDFYVCIFNNFLALQHK